MHPRHGQARFDGEIGAALRAALVLTAALLVAGCTHPRTVPPATLAPPASTAQPHTTDALPQQVATRTAAAKTFGFMLAIHYEGGGVTASTSTLHGTFDVANHVGWSDVLSSDEDHPSGQRALLIGTTLYQRTDDPKAWMKLQPLHPGVDLGLLGATSGDPSPYLGLLRGGGQAATKVGTATVRGVPTDRYTLTLDLDRYFGSLGPPAMRAASAYKLAGRVPADMWIDAQRRLRRLRFHLDMTVPAPPPYTAGGRTVQELTLELFDFGVPVHVTPPPADQVCAMPTCTVSPTTIP
jgi:hypothetical protein